jgi:hypothetical protein
LLCRGRDIERSAAVLRRRVDDGARLIKLHEFARFLAVKLPRD